MKSPSLVKIKTGYFRGILARFYPWREQPPEDIGGTFIAEKALPLIDHVWVGRPHERVDKSYIVEFSGFMKIPESGVYKLFVVANNGIKLWLGGKLLISSWVDSPTRRIESKPLDAEKGYYRVRLLHYCRHGFSEVRLGWVKPNKIEEIVPTDNLAFTIGEHVFFQIPGGYSVVAVPVKTGIREKRCTSLNNVCVLEVSYDEQPFITLISVYDHAGRPVYRTTEPIELWGGDVLELKF